MPLKSVLKIIGISSSRYHVWDKKQHCDNLDDESSCPKTTPNQLTIEEIFAIKDMAISDEYRHVPTSTLKNTRFARYEGTRHSDKRVCLASFTNPRSVTFNTSSVGLSMATILWTETKSEINTSHDRATCSPVSIGFHSGTSLSFVFAKRRKATRNDK